MQALDIDHARTLLRYVRAHMVAQLEQIRSVAVIGAGTMGHGIAQVAALAGFDVRLYDALTGAARAGVDRIAKNLAKGVELGKVTAAARDAAIARVTAADALGDACSGADCVIEAVPEVIELKREIFEAVDRDAPAHALFATNTSSLPVAEIAAAVRDGSRVVGMHFFNPPPLMRLVEVIAGLESSDEAVALARAAGEAMGKRVVEAADGPGFIVNRCNRPFGLEALKLLSEGGGLEPADVDRICRLGGGFRMGPFELSDLVGVDVGFEVAKSFYELSFGEPRWRPSPLQARVVASGRHGRKTGRGWYVYEEGEPHRPDDPRAPEGAGGEGRLVVIAGELPVADELRDLAADDGYAVVEPDGAEGEVPWLGLDCGWEEDEPPLQGGPIAVLCADGSLHALDPGGGAVGFHALPPLPDASLVELTRSATTTAVAAERAEAFFSSLGRHVAWVPDAPGLVLGRIVCQLVNEACFAVAEGVGTPEDIDAGMVLGLNHPRGPFAWLRAIGAAHVLAVLDALRLELGEERYRAAPMLRRMAIEE
jgi:3-hydroxybutyryl-CoA dehydrogenase